VPVRVVDDAFERFGEVPNGGHSALGSMNRELVMNVEMLGRNRCNEYVGSVNKWVGREDKCGGVVSRKW
jgi:hypothetical protein